MRVAINLLTDDPAHPSGAHWFWTRIIPEMAPRLPDGRGAAPPRQPAQPRHAPGLRRRRPLPHLPVVERAPRAAHPERAGVGPAAAPASRIDVFSTLIAPVVKPAPSVVAHFKTMHAFTAPQSMPPVVRLYRRMSYPRTAKRRGRDHHQLREPACGGRALPRRRPRASCA